MSVIRFVHTDHLRLGSALTGLADCPDWLRRTAASAVRVAVASVIEATIASGSQLLLIAGRLAETSEDLGLAVEWLASQRHHLQRYGIRVVLMGDDGPAQLRALDALICRPDQCLDVRMCPDGQLQLEIIQMESNQTNGQSQNGETRKEDALRLRMCSNAAQAAAWQRHNADFTYVAVPAVSAGQPSTGCGGAISTARLPGSGVPAVSVQTGRSLMVTAGAPQSVSPQERGRFGCCIVEADPATRMLSSRFCPTDAFRYSQEFVHCDEPTTAADLVARLVERSRLVNHVNGRTSVVDWVITGTLKSDMHQLGSLDEPALLQQLRERLQAGHAGVWPRRIHYGAETRIIGDNSSSLAVQEFLSVLDEQRGATVGHQMPVTLSNQSIRCLPQGGCAMVTGLELLSRVA